MSNEARRVALTVALDAAGASPAAKKRALAKKPRKVATARDQRMAATVTALDAMGVKPGPTRHPAMKRAYRGA